MVKGDILDSTIGKYDNNKTTSVVKICHVILVILCLTETFSRFQFIAISFPGRSICFFFCF